MDFKRPERCQRQRTGREDRRSKFYEISDNLAEHIHTALLQAPDGLTRTQLRDLLHRNIPVRRVEQALANLAAADKADRQRILTTGRPAELWTAKR